MDYEGVEWIQLAQDMVEQWAVVDVSVKRGEFDLQSDY
jgi:hypothetical protein